MSSPPARGRGQFPAWPTHGRAVWHQSARPRFGRVSRRR